MRLKEPTRLCKLCFKDVKANDIYHFSDSSIDICASCLSNINPTFERFEVKGYKALSIYNYDERIKALIYQLKGCFDIEIAHVFLLRYKLELSLWYKGYTVVPIPSYKEDDEIREFNHVEEIIKLLGLPMKKLLEKTAKVKQANSSAEERKQISKHLKLTSEAKLFGEKILLVDDVYTTGSTMKAAVSLIEKLKPKTIKILVISKTTLK